MSYSFNNLQVKANSLGKKVCPLLPIVLVGPLQAFDDAHSTYSNNDNLIHPRAGRPILKLASLLFHPH